MPLIFWITCLYTLFFEISAATPSQPINISLGGFLKIAGKYKYMQIDLFESYLNFQIFNTVPTRIQTKVFTENNQFWLKTRHPRDIPGVAGLTIDFVIVKSPNHNVSVMLTQNTTKKQILMHAVHRRPFEYSNPIPLDFLRYDFCSDTKETNELASTLSVYRVETGTQLDQPFYLVDALLWLVGYGYCDAEFVFVTKTGELFPSKRVSDCGVLFGSMTYYVAVSEKGMVSRPSSVVLEIVQRSTEYSAAMEMHPSYCTPQNSETSVLHTTRQSLKSRAVHVPAAMNVELRLILSAQVDQLFTRLHECFGGNPEEPDTDLLLLDPTNVLTDAEIPKTQPAGELTPYSGSPITEDHASDGTSFEVDTDLGVSAPDTVLTEVETSNEQVDGSSLPEKGS